MRVAKLIHKDGKLLSLTILSTEWAESALTQLLQSNPQAYGRLMEYKQCRYQHKELKYYWLMNAFDIDTISIMVKKELASHATSP
jgi:hypothetical protein